MRHQRILPPNPKGSGRGVLRFPRRYGTSHSGLSFSPEATSRVGEPRLSLRLHPQSRAALEGQGEGFLRNFSAGGPSHPGSRSRHHLWCIPDRRLHLSGKGHLYQRGPKGHLPHDVDWPTIGSKQTSVILRFRRVDCALPAQRCLDYHHAHRQLPDVLRSGRRGELYEHPLRGA